MSPEQPTGRNSSSETSANTETAVRISRRWHTCTRIRSDGGTDIEALAHLYKNQVYQLAHYFKVTPEIIDRSPSPDTFSLPVSDQEFFFRIPFDKLDLLLFAWEHAVSTLETAEVTGLSEEAVKRAFVDYTTKNRATAHLRELPPAL